MQNNHNLSAKVYQDIKNMMITLVFPPGSTLREQMLADMLKVSRTPVREALQRLNHEGWVKIGNRRSIRVCPVTLRDINEVFQLREILEPCAAKSALEKGRSRILAAKLDEVTNVMEQVCEDRIAFAKLDMQFHSLIIQNVENERLNRFWKTLHEETSRIAVMNLTNDTRPKIVVEEHSRIAEAFWEKDPDAVLLAINTHLTGSAVALTKMLDDEQPTEALPAKSNIRDFIEGGSHKTEAHAERSGNE